MGGMRTVTQRDIVGDTSIDIVAYHQTLILEDEILTTQAEINRQAAVPELVEAAKGLCLRIEEFQTRQPEVLMRAMRALTAALDKVKTE